MPWVQVPEEEKQGHWEAFGKIPQVAMPAISPAISSRDISGIIPPAEELERLPQEEPATPPFQAMLGEKTGKAYHQFLYNLGNTLGFNLPGELLKRVPESIYEQVGIEKQRVIPPAPEGTIESLAAGTGQLVGTIAGPLQAIGKGVSKIPYFAKQLPGIKGIIQNIGRHILTLGTTSAVMEHGGEGVEENIPRRLMAGAGGGLTGAVFGGAQFVHIPQKPILSMVMRMGAGTTALDLLRGVRPWDERELVEKAYHYGLDAWFLRYGMRPPSGLAEKLQKEVKIFNQEAKTEKVPIELTVPQKAAPKPQGIKPARQVRILKKEYSIGQKLYRGDVSYVVSNKRANKIPETAGVFTEYEVLNLRSGEKAYRTDAEIKDLFSTTRQAPYVKPDKTYYDKFWAEEAIPTEPEIAQVKLPKILSPKGGGIPAGMPLPQEVGGIRIDKLNDSHEVRSALISLAEALPPKQRQTIAETRRIAENLNMSPEQYRGWSKRWGNKAPAIAERGRQMMGAAAQQVVEAQQTHAQTGTVQSLLRFMEAIERGGMITHAVRGTATTAGRTLNIYRQIFEAKEGTLASQAAIKLLKKITGGDITKAMELFNKFSTIDLNDPVAVMKFMQEHTDVKVKDKIFEAWVNGLLSAPPTHVVNTATNTMNLFSKPVETFVAAGFEAIRAPLGRRPRAVTFKEAAYELMGIWHGRTEAVQRALFAWNNEMTMAATSKLELAHTPAIGGKLGRFVRTPGRLMITADEFFKGAIYTSDIYGKAYQQAYQAYKRGEIPKNQIQTKASELIQSPTQGMRDHAVQEALYRTFQKDYGTIGRAFSNLRRDIPFARYVIPFLRTPVNIVKYALERTPLNLPRVVRLMARGEISQAEISQEMAKVALGSWTAMAAIALAFDGKITGSGPKDPRKRAQLYRTGWIPYSLKIGDKYYQYSRFEPFGIILGLSADATEIWKDLHRGVKDELAARLMLSITQNLTNKTFLSGLSDAIQAASDPERYGKRWMERLAGSAIPSVVAAGARATDPYLRDTQGLMDFLKSRIPGLSQSIQPRLDVYGKPIERPMHPAARFTIPAQISKERPSDVDEELGRLDIALGMPGKVVGGNKLSHEAYSQYASRSGIFLAAELRELMDSVRYYMASDVQKKRLVRKAIDSSRAMARREFGLETKRFPLAFIYE